MLNGQDGDLYYPLLKKFRTPLITGKKKSSWDKYKDLYRMLTKFRGCTSVLISVRGLIAQTTLTNKVTADYINFYFWGMCDRTKNYLRSIDPDDDIVCIRMSTSYYETTVTVGGTNGDLDFMIFVTQSTPTTLKRPIYHLKNLLVQGEPPCDFPVEEVDPVAGLRNAIAEMSDRIPDAGLSPYVRKRIAFLSKENESGTKSSMMSDVGSVSKRTLTMATRDDNSSQTTRGGRTRSAAASKAPSGSTSVYSSRSDAGTKWSNLEGSRSGSKQLFGGKEKKFHTLRKEKYNWIKIDKDDPLIPPEVAPLYERTTSQESSDEEDQDIGYWRKRPDQTFCIYAPDGSVIQDEVTIGFKPSSGEQFPPRKWTSKKVKKEMVFKRRPTHLLSSSLPNMPEQSSPDEQP